MFNVTQLLCSESEPELARMLARLALGCQGCWNIKVQREFNNPTLARQISFLSINLEVLCFVVYVLTKNINHQTKALYRQNAIILFSIISNFYFQLKGLQICEPSRYEISISHLGSTLLCSNLNLSTWNHT